MIPVEPAEVNPEQKAKAKAKETSQMVKGMIKEMG